jgi:hypothetical protein
MKRKWGVVVITLPVHKGLPSLPSLHPFEAGDIVPYKHLSGLAKTKQCTIPVNLMKRKTLVVDLFSATSGNHIAVFPPMESLKKFHSGRTHVLALGTEPMIRSALHLGGASQTAIALEVQSLEHLYCRFILDDHLPSMVLVNEDNIVLHTAKGVYLSRHNIKAFVKNNLALQHKRLECRSAIDDRGSKGYPFRPLKTNY